MTNSKKPDLPLVELVVRSHCRLCNSVQQWFEHILMINGQFRLKVINLDHDDIRPSLRQSYITPATWVNGKLWYYGKVDEKHFLQRIELENMAHFQDMPQPE